MAHKKPGPGKPRVKPARVKMPHDDLGILLLGDEKLTITKIRLINGTISFEAEGVCENDYALRPITGVTILDPKRDIVYAEPGYEVPKLKTILKGDRLNFIFNLDPQLRVNVERWVRAE